MSDRRALWQGLVAGAMVVTIAACATGQKSMMGDPVAERQRLMKHQGANWAEIQAKLKAGNVEAIAVNAEALALTAQRIPGLFPEGSLTDKSKAKPEVWQKWDEFTAAAKNLENRATGLRDQAMKKDAAGVETTVKDFGRLACGTCHTPFRVPPPPAPR